ncbi:ROK family transcriptional regulator [Actinomyces sp. 2119]|uniref:ROK family transcriptional regulator n=1 Tax=Actinomyces sp. 2119 TaxID=2321393 RepID=UPI000E6D2C46|nr:ROK family transcriptional regulator [Actinomyces sp. 2119]RJF42564.1 ROK family transcriptional regulator [Actinomyces sp. 2119]
MAGSGRTLGARVLVALVAAGPLSRTELGERLGLSAATTTRTVRPLLEAGKVAERPPQEQTGPGRPTRTLAVVEDCATFLGVKLTADRLYAVLTSPVGAVLEQEAVPLERTDPEAVVALVASVAASLGARRGRMPDTIGISLGAAVAGDSVVKVAAFLGWRDVPLAELVSAATGVACTVANDVRAFAYAEAWFGVGRGADPFALVTLGEGIGCGLVVGGEVVSGAHGAAGSIGHLPVAVPEGPTGSLHASSPGATDIRCEVGHVGCARAVASTSGITRAVATRLGRELTMAEVLDPRTARQSEVREILRTAARAAGRLVGSLVAFLDPALTVVSGEGVAVLQAHRDVFEAEVARLRHWSASPAAVQLRPFEFEEWARGAAALAVDRWADLVGAR